MSDPQPTPDRLSTDDPLGILAENVRLRGLVETLEATLAYWLVPADEIDDPAIPLTVRVYRTKEGRFLAVQRDALIEERDAAAGLVETATRIVREHIELTNECMNRTQGTLAHAGWVAASAALTDLQHAFAAAGLLTDPQPDTETPE